jgi:hypothetical protein
MLIGPEEVYPDYRRIYSIKAPGWFKGVGFLIIIISFLAAFIMNFPEISWIKWILRDFDVIKSFLLIWSFLILSGFIMEFIYLIVTKSISIGLNSKGGVPEFSFRRPSIVDQKRHESESVDGGGKGGTG